MILIVGGENEDGESLCSLFVSGLKYLILGK